MQGQKYQSLDIRDLLLDHNKFDSFHISSCQKHFETENV